MATGSSYPGSLDAWVDKISGDFLTVADVNQRTSAIEKLETGPLRPDDGSSAIPAYAFRSAGSSGMYYAPATPKIGLAIGGTAVAEIIKSASAVNYITLSAAATANPASITPAGSDTNIGLLLNTKGTGNLIFDIGGAIKAQIDSTGRFLLGTTAVGGASASDLIVAYGTQIRMADSGGINAVGLIGLDGSNRVGIAPGGGDIVWGRSLITLGGGATPTFGTIGGAGPTVAAQFRWMQVVDNGGAAFWVPVWR